MSAAQRPAHTYEMFIKPVSFDASKALDFRALHVDSASFIKYLIYEHMRAN
jgi:hypothetical protein